MPRHSTRSLAEIPEIDDVWILTAVRLRTWIAPPDAKPYRPYAALIISMENGVEWGVDIFPAEPTPEQMRDVLFKTMYKPQGGQRKPARPQGVAIADLRLLDSLQQAFTEAGLSTAIYQIELPPEFGEIIRSLEAELRQGEPENPGLFSVEGVTPELVGEFYAAAAEFYRAAPWVSLNNYQVLAVRHPEERDYRYAIVMGQGGVEYGLASYLTWRDVEQQFLSQQAPTDKIPEGGLQSLFYDQITMVPFDDIDAIEQHGWEIAAENAYPIPIIIGEDGQPHRPSRRDLEWYIAALRAIPRVIPALQSNGQGGYTPLDTTIPIPWQGGTLNVAVQYEPGRLKLGQQPTKEWHPPEEQEGQATIPFDRRTMERAFLDLMRPGEEQAETSDDPLTQAQMLMYDAWEEPKPAKRIELARQALKISPDCADAYVLLAEEEAKTLDRALDYYRQGVAAGERALGPESFHELEGQFWGVLETRPYMRARAGLADTLWRLNRKEEALTHYRDMLRLNPGDNQGIRYILIDLLLQMGRDDEARDLLKDYADDWSAVWQYTRALLAFRKEGTSASAARVLSEAFKQNPFVPDYITGKKRIPNVKPEFIGMGDEQEAVNYASEHLNYWRRTPGAVEWLQEQWERKQAKPAKKLSRQSGAGKIPKSSGASKRAAKRQSKSAAKKRGRK